MYRECRNIENLNKRLFDGVGEYSIPQLKAMQWEDCTFIDFSSAAACRNKQEKGIHFFIDDYRFIRLWTHIDKYVDLFRQFCCVMTPDFSIYTDFPKAIQIYNHYRKHWIGAYLQEMGIHMIPTISWSNEESFTWCFDGEPCGGVVAVSSIGTQKDRRAKQLFIKGYQELIQRLDPETILFYGKIPSECTGNLIRITAFQEKFQKAACSKWQDNQL